MVEINSSGMPSVAIPHTLQRDSWGWPFFCIDTPQGMIHVEVGRCKELWCTGTPEAVIAYGLTRPEWLPGVAGNNLTSQRVAFDADAPRLILGKRIGKQPKKAARIVVEAWGFIKRTVRVRIPMSPEQIAFVEAMPDEDNDIPEATRAAPMPRVVPAYRVEGNVIFLPSIWRESRELQ